MHHHTAATTAHCRTLVTGTASGHCMRDHRPPTTTATTTLSSGSPHKRTQRAQVRGPRHPRRSLAQLQGHDSGALVGPQQVHAIHQDATYLNHCNHDAPGSMEHSVVVPAGVAVVDGQGHTVVVPHQKVDDGLKAGVGVGSRV